VLIWFYEETPLHFANQASRTDDQEKKDLFKAKAEGVLKKYNNNLYDIELEKKILFDRIDKGKHTLARSFKKLFYMNCWDPAKRVPCLTVILFNSYTCFSGQVYNDTYTTSVFKKLVNEDFGYMMTFYSGIALLVGGTLSVMTVEKFGRLTVIYISWIGQMIAMWWLAYAFYFDHTGIAIGAQVCYSFILYYGSTITILYCCEISEPFVVSIGIASNWVLKSIIGKILPLIYDNLPLYWMPLIMGLSGAVLFIVCQPLFVETKGKTFNVIDQEYAEFKYRFWHNEK
jgi:hypothetical protein